MIHDLAAALGPVTVLVLGATLDYSGLGGALLLGGSIIALVLGLTAGRDHGERP